MKLFGRKKSSGSEEKAKAGKNRGGGPGASSVGGNTTVFRVTVPDNVRPGEEFQVYAHSRIVRVKCPPDSKPGQTLQITVPTDPNRGQAPGGPRLPPDSPNVRRIEGSSPPAYMVTIPDGIRSGQQFNVMIQGQQLMVTCPPNAGPGRSVRIVPPPPPSDVSRPPSSDAPMGGPQAPKPPREKEPTQLFRT